MSKNKNTIKPLDIWLHPTRFHPTLAAILGHYNKAVRSVAVFSFFLNLLMLAVPIYLLQIYDRVLPNRSTDTLLVLMLIIVVAVIAYGLIDRLRGNIVTKLGVWIQNTLSTELMSGSIRRSIERETDVSAGVISDLESAKNLLTGSLLTSVLDLVLTPIFIIALFWLHPLLGWIVIAGLAAMVLITYLRESKAQHIVAASSENRRETTQSAADYLRHAELIHSMGMQRHLLPHWQQMYNKSSEATVEAEQLTTGLQSSVKTIRMGLQIAVLSAAAWLILSDSITAGATMASLLLMQRVVGPYERILTSWKYVMRGLGAMERINQRLGYNRDETMLAGLPATTGPVHAEKIRYRYKDQPSSVFSDLRLTVLPREITVITGPSAGGKSTLLKLLAGVIKPSSGTLTLNRHDYSTWPAEMLGSQTGYLPQSTELLDGNVRQNIARMDQGDIANVIQAASMAGIHEMIESLPHGYETRTGAGGHYFSPGEVRRICLARAIYRNPTLVILDEPDATLDIGGRVALAITINKLKARGCMVVMSTQQPDLMQFADRVYLLEDKKLSVLKAPQPSTQLTSSDGTLPAGAFA